MKTITRRELLKTAAVAVGGTILLNRPVTSWALSADAKSRVVLVREQNLLSADNKPDVELCRQMLDRALCTLTGESSTQNAWSKIIKPDDILGIKTNAWNKLPTPPELEQILKNKAVEAGVKEENISVADKGVLQDPVFQKATALINIRPMRTHAWSGVGSLIKNYIMFDPKPSSYHDDSCASLATLHELPIVKGKTRLHILVMFRPQFHHLAAHHFSDEHLWNYCGLLAGFDPVAVDSVGLRIIQGKRNEYFKEDKPLNPPAKHIELADKRYNLGTCNPAKIELIKLGWDFESYV